MLPRIVHSRLFVLGVLGVVGAGVGCAASGPARLATDAPLRYDPDNVERVRVVRVMEEQRVIVERADRRRYLLEFGNGCQQALQGAAELGSVPALVEVRGGFADAGAKLVFPVKRQACAIERAAALE